MEGEVPSGPAQQHPSEFEDGSSERSDLHNDEEVPLREVTAGVEDDDDCEPSILGEEPQVEQLYEDPHEEVQEVGSKRLAIKVPIQPTDEERREHEISHIPYRSWCGDCVRGKGLTSAHRRHSQGEEEKEQRRPLIALDYFYLGQDEEQSLPILAMVEEKTGRTYAICMPEKGVRNNYNAAAAAKVLKVSGCLGGILKSDTERALVALRSRLQEMYPTLGTEDATKGESQSNGLIESYVGKIQAQARTMKSALDRHYPGLLHSRHPVLPWMIDYAAALMSRFNRGSDGFTPYERSTGKKWRVQVPEFGEAVWYQPLKGERASGKLEAKFEEGIFLGIQEGSALKWVGTPTGVQRSWSIKCKAGSDRWDQAMMEVMIGLPWKLTPKLEGLDKGVSLPAQIEVELPPQVEDDKEAERPRKRGYRPRGIYIRRDVELEEYGYTPGCDGCEAAQLGLSHKHHSMACKKRIRDEMMKTPEGKKKVEAIEKRAEEFIVRYKEEADKAKQSKRPAEESQSQVQSKQLRSGEQEFDELEGKLIQEGILPPPPLVGAAPQSDPLPDEEFSGRGGDRESVPVDANTVQEELQSTMDVGSLQVWRYRGDEFFQDCVREADLVETMSQLDDEVVDSQRLRLQLGSVGMYEAYGIDPYGKKPTVMEIFSPPRLTVYGAKKGLIEGVALDLTTTNAHGVPWDFSQKERRDEAMQLIDDLQPELILGCPPCGPYSVLQNLNKDRADQAQFQQKLSEARDHLEFCADIYQKQIDRNKFFLHEHPDLAGSWDEPVMKRLQQHPKVQRVKGDMCRHGMTGKDEFGVGAVKKRTGFLTNSGEIAAELGILCENKSDELRVWKRIDFGATKAQSLKRGGPEWKQVVRRVTMDVNDNKVLQDLHNFQQASRADLWFNFGCERDIVTVFYYKDEGSKWHRHVQLIGGKAKKAEVYPDKLLHNILKGLKREMQRKCPMNSLEFGPVNEEPYFEDEALDGQDWNTFVDEVSGKALETSRVQAARAEELEFARRYGVWTLAPTRECWESTGKGPIGCRWIDIDKGDSNKPNYRSRLVIQEVRMSGTEAIFAATPPLESVRFLLSLQRSKKGYRVMFIDIRRAHWTAKIDRLVYVRLPAEAIPDGYSEPMCGRLNKAMYGCRDAARQWEAEITDFFVTHGFVPGLGSPVLFVNTVRDIKVTVHGDDVTALGRPEDLHWLKEKFLERYEIKYGGMLGDGPEDVQDVMILNRLVHYDSFETTIEADPRHVQILLKELNLENAKEVATPGVRCDETDSETLSAAEMSRYRSLVMRGCYLALDRPDVAYACKELARAMSSPRKCDWNGLKRLGRYLKGVPRLVWRYPEQIEQGHFTMFTDSDDAGCSRTRKSTSAGALMHGAHLIKFYSSTQHVISLSSGESEFYAGIKAGSTLLGAMSMSLDLGELRGGVLAFDATAAKAMLSRKGHGRAKHIDRSYLWLQQRVHNGDLRLEKVGTKMNGADLGTKHLDRNQIETLCNELNLHVAQGCHRLSLKV